MNVLITGGAGFIGSHLAERLLRLGHRVTVLDDLSTGSRANIDHLAANPGFTTVIDTIFNESVLAEQVDRCHVVVHLAAAVGVKLVIEAPVRTIRTNVAGTDTVLRHASRGGKRVLIASTSEVYGKRTSVPFAEDSDLQIGSPHFNRWAYACSKALDEFLGLAYWKEHRLPVVIVRPFNTVGPRQTGRYGMVLPTFVRQALAGEPLTVFGDGSQTRSFIDVSDVVEALAGLLDHPRAGGEIFNIGNPQETSIRQLAELVIQATGSSSTITTVPYEEAYMPGFEDMLRRVPDISRIHGLTGWRPTVTLPDIIERVVAHVRREQEPGVPVRSGSEP